MAAWRCLEVAQGSNDQLSCFYTPYNPPPLQQSCIGYGGEIETRQSGQLGGLFPGCYGDAPCTCTSIAPTVVSGHARIYCLVT